MKSGRASLGYKQTLKTLRSSKSKLVIISNNCPPSAKSEIEYYAMLAEVQRRALPAERRPRHRAGRGRWSVERHGPGRLRHRPRARKAAALRRGSALLAARCGYVRAAGAGDSGTDPGGALLALPAAWSRPGQLCGHGRRCGPGAHRAGAPWGPDDGGNAPRSKPRVPARMIASRSSTTGCRLQSSSNRAASAKSGRLDHTGRDRRGDARQRTTKTERVPSGSPRSTQSPSV